MSTDEFLSKANSQNSRPVKRVFAATLREGGPSRGVVSAIGLGLLLVFLVICGLGSVVCDIEFSPRFRLICPAQPITPTPITPTTPEPITPVPTTPTTPEPITPVPTTPTTPEPTTPVVTAPVTITPTTLCTLLTPNPAAKTAAVNMALSLSDQFLRNYGVSINTAEAIPFNPICVGTDSDQLLGMIAPVSDANQRYKDREVEGIFYINDSRLVIETIILLNKSATQDSTLPFGGYMLACGYQRLDDCIAVSPQGAEFQIKPESIELTNDWQETNPPRVAYEQGSIRKCFYVWKRRVCIRVFR
jgi:hypothetical protein